MVKIAKFVQLNGSHSRLYQTYEEIGEHDQQGQKQIEVSYVQNEFLGYIKHQILHNFANKELSAMT